MRHHGGCSFLYGKEMTRDLVARRYKAGPTVLLSHSLHKPVMVSLDMASFAKKIMPQRLNLISPVLKESNQRTTTMISCSRFYSCLHCCCCCCCGLSSEFPSTVGGCSVDSACLHSTPSCSDMHKDCERGGGGCWVSCPIKMSLLLS